jgi:hypothetical protein
VLWDRLWLGDRYDPSSRSIGYLFAPALLTSTSGERDQNGRHPPGAEKHPFDAHTFIMGNLHEGSEEVDPESISVGTVSGEIPWVFNETPVRLTPHSTELFEDGAVFGTLAADAVVDWNEGKTVLAAGTRFFLAGLRMEPDWAIPPRDTRVTVKKLSFPVPAGSTIRSQWERVTGIVFSKPVRIRAGGVALSVFSAGFASSGPNYLTGAALAAPAMISIGGKAAALIDRVTFDELGSLSSGRLQADTAFTVGGRTVSFRGGYDPEEPETGIVAFFPSGRIHSGALAGAADFQIGKSKVRLIRGDSVSFHEDGSVETCTSSAGITVFAGGRQVGFKQLVVNPDGTVASGALAADTTLEVGGTAATFLGGSGITFHPSGSIWVGTLTATIVKLRGIDARIEGETVFFENGVPVYAVPMAAVTVGGVTISFRDVKLDSSGRVREGELTSPTDLLVGGRHYIFSSSISFLEDGSVKSGGLSTSLSVPFSFMIDGTPLKTSLQYVAFYPDGGLKWAETPADSSFTFNNEKIPDSSLVYVYRSKKGEESTFFFPRKEQYQVQLTEDVPIMIAGEEIWMRAGSKVDTGFFTDSPDGTMALLSKDVTVTGSIVGHADSLVSMTELAKSIMEIKVGVPNAPALYAASAESRVRVRRAANLQGETVGFLEKDDRVKVLEKSADKMKVGDMTDNWYRIQRVSDGLSGWTYGHYLVPEQ